MSTNINTFVANLSFLFTELPFMERFKAAKEAGFSKVEFMFPYDYDLDEIESVLHSLGLTLVLFNLPAGDWANGERGIAAKPERKNEFRAGVGKAIAAAQKLGVSQVNCLVGKGNPEMDPSELRSLMVENLSFAAEKLEEYGIRLMIEPINHYDIPGFALNTTEQVLTLIEELNCPNVFLQWDIYHASRENEDLFEILRTSLAKIGHIQIADQPGRHQPGTGQIDFQTLLTDLKKVGYSKEIALEYVPDPDTQTSLGWVKNIQL